jgi:RNA polymerase sigma-70 factor, ECF subfamily
LVFVAVRPRAAAVPLGRRRAREEETRAVFAAHYPQLAGWCARLVGDPELGHDIATEAFTRLLARWSSVSEPRAYLYMTATNIARDHWRRRERERRALALVHNRERTEHAPSADTAATIDVRDVVDRLPERLRTPVLLHYIADMSVAEVAHALGRPEGTVKRNLYDARARLLAALTDRERAS